MDDYFQPLREEIEHYLSPSHIKVIYQAYRVAKEAHEGQMRLSGEPYITHPVAAAVILAEMRMDYQSIMATLLHDVLEDTAVTKDELIALFGHEVADLVDGVSKLTQIKFGSRAEAQAENFRKMVLAMVRDIRVILVKLADRLHNTRTLSAVPREKKRRMAIETLEIYAPIAHRLGMHNLFVELEDLGFEALYPMRHRILTNAVNSARGSRKRIMRRIEKDLQHALQKASVPVVALFGRKKHLYSIYEKMRDKGMVFSEVMDVYGFRLIVRDIDTCYRALGAVHQTYKPLPERFKDYISIPKVNGYQSLHTTLFGPFGVPIEVQIRTEDMDRVAENGIAAHWLYKSQGVAADASQLRARAWIKSLIDMQQSAGSSLEFIENVKIDVFPDEVYVFTPKGHIMELPMGATPVDFAYMVHSDVGNSCIAVRINRRLAPLSRPLANGQTIEIITAPGARPNPDWLNFVVPGKARSNIRHFLKGQQNKEACSLGKRLLNKALHDLGVSLSAVPKERLENLLHELNYPSKKELYYALGMGQQVPLVMARRLVVLPDKAEASQKPCPLAITGTEGMVVSYADCCHPIPGDPIVGCLQEGRGILVHVENCPQVEKFRSHIEKFIVMRWEETVKAEFLVDLIAEVLDGRGVLASLSRVIFEAEANIEDINLQRQGGNYHRVKFTLSVRNRIHLARVMRRLKNVKNVMRLYRSKASL